MEYVLINKLSDIEPFMNKIAMAKIIAIDTETTGLNPRTDRLRLIQIATTGMPTLVIDCFIFLPEGITLLTKILKMPFVKIFQNAKFDLQFFMKLGIMTSLPIFDTMLASQLLHTSGGPAKANLSALVQYYLHKELYKDEQKSDFSGKLREAQLVYAAKDAEILLELREAIVYFIQENGLVQVANLEFACVRAVAQMEFQGIYLNLKMWELLKIKTIEERGIALDLLYVYTGKPMAQTSLFGEDVLFGENFDSNKQMLSLLHRHGIMITDTSHHSLMQYVEHPLVIALLEYRRANKALSTFLEPYSKMVDAKGRLYPHYGQIGAWSGRMSCGGPNIQQIPRSIDFRDCFTAPPGRKLVLADYSQIELRVAAEIAKDKRMIKAYKDGEDLHRLTATLISGKKLSDITKEERQSAKAVNFGLIFAMGAAGLKAYAKDTYGVEMSIETAILFRQKFFEAYSGICTWHRKLKEYPPKQSRTLAGRKHIYGDNAGLSGFTNTPVQGSAADIVKQALGILLEVLAPYDAFMIAVVHDEILIECDEKDAENIALLLKKSMEEAGAYYLKEVPILAEAKIADSWAEK